MIIDQETTLFKIAYPNGTSRKVAAANKNEVVQTFQLDGLEGVTIETLETVGVISTKKTKAARQAATDEVLQKLQERLTAANASLERALQKRQEDWENARWYKPWTWYNFVDMEY